MSTAGARVCASRPSLGEHPARSNACRSARRAKTKRAPTFPGRPLTSAGDLLLGVDIGTSSSKGCLVTADGSVVAKAQRPHEVSRPRPGRVEIDAEILWDDLA